MTIREEIAKNILFYRKKRDFTQKQLADLVGVQSSSVSNWEKGTNSIDIDNLHKVCVIFNVSVDEMFGAFANHGHTDTESKLINDFRQLSNQGKDYILNQMEIAKNIYINSDEGEFSDRKAN